MIRLWTRALRSRPVGAVLLLLLTTVAVATAALGPLLVRATAQSALADTVADAGATATLITTSVPLEAGERYDQARTQVLVPFARIDQGHGDLWAAPTTEVASRQNISWTPPTGTAGRTVSRVNASDPGCPGYVLTDGRCPTYDGEVLVSADDARQTKLALGHVIGFKLSTSKVAALRVVGTYDASSSLVGRLVRPGSVLAGPVTDGSGGEGAGIEGAPTGDPLVVTGNQLFGLRLPVTVSGRLLPGTSVRVDDEPALRATLASVAQLAANGVPGRTLFFDSDLGSVLDRYERLSADAAVVITVTVAQALAVAFFALAIVLQRVGRARAAEWGIGRLRGLPRRRWFGAIFAEPGVALAVGWPLGLALGGLLARLSATAHLRAGTPIELGRWPVQLAGAAAFLGAVLALVAVTVAAVRRPTVELIQQSAERRRLSRVGAAGQAGIVLLAGAALYQLLTSDQLTAGGSQLGLLAPALLALAIAVLAVRAGVLVVRRVTGRPPRSRVGLVVGRQIGRTPSSVNPAVVIAAGLALAVFAGQVLALSERNQDLRARVSVGAGSVLQVKVPDGVDLIDAVAAADPSGRYAMAAAETPAASSSGTSRIVAVDSRRFAAVTTWSSAWSDTPDVAAKLAPSLSPPVILRGTTVKLALRDVEVHTMVGTDPFTQTPVTGVTPTLPGMALDLTSTVADDGDLGELKPGATSLTANIKGCAQGCRLIGIRLFSQYGSAYQVSFTITGISTDQQSAADLAEPLRAPGWHRDLGDPTQDERDAGVSATGETSDTGLRVQAGDPSGTGYVSLRPGDTAQPVPVLLAPRVPEVPVPGVDGVVLGNDLDSRATLLRPLGRASVLPRSGNDGVLVDLRNVRSGGPDASLDEVWLAPGAPPEVEQALVAGGLQILSRETLAATEASLRRQPVTRAAAVATTVGYAALGLALLTLLAARLADVGRRRRAAHALREAGLSRRAVWRLAVVETLVPALLGAVVGVAAGTVAVVLAAPRLPLVDSLVPGPPLDLGLAVLPTLTVAAATVVLIVLVAVVVATVETRDREDRR